MIDVADLLRHADAVERELDRLDCEERLLPFVRRHWRVLEPTIPLVEGWALDAICEHLEAITNGDIRKLLINVPPGFMKSLMTDVFWPAWEWGPKRLAHHRFVTFSYAATLTLRDNGRFRDLLLSPEYRELWGDECFKLTKIGEEKVANNRTGWKFASSVKGVGTGERGNRVIIDDPHNIVEGESEAVRGETVRWFRESIQNRLNDVTQDAIIVIMQRVHETDVSGEIVTLGMDYEHLMIPMEWDGRHYYTSIGWSDPRANEPDGTLAWPERFPAESVANLKRDLGEYGYAAQYQQVPSPRGGGLIRRDWWEPWDEREARRHGIPAGQFPPFEYVVASLDTAYTEKESNDYSAMTIWGVWQDRFGQDKLMMIYAWRDRLALPDLVRKVLSICRSYNVDRLLIEAKAAGLSSAQEIRRLMVEELRARQVRSAFPDFGFGIELVNPKGLDKVNRVTAIAALFEEGLIYAPGFAADGTWVDWADMVISECASFPKGAHDDLVDTVSQALRYMRNVGIAKRPIERKTEVAESMRYKSRGPNTPLYPV